MLWRVLTQNTDGLHLDSGLAQSRVVNAHGTHGKANCAVCKAPFDFNELDQALRKGVPTWCMKCAEAGHRHPIKPSVVFFNEALP